jgi:hypothetical protein
MKDSDLRRFVLAFAAALAIHEVFAALVPWNTQSLSPAPAEKITIAKLVRIEHRATPAPSPVPTPTPFVQTHTPAPTHVRPRIVNPGKPAEKQRVKRIASAHPLVRTRHHSKPSVHVPVGGHGAGTSKKAVALTGSLGPGGTGTGTSGNANGAGGAPEGIEPCGYVEFYETADPTIDPSTGQVWEHLMISVHFPGGAQQTQPLDYPFYYASRDQDPFMQNTRVATFQFPPPAQRADEPALVQYVMQHTTPDGLTKLKDCPR